MAKIELGFSCGQDWDRMTPGESGARRCGACGQDVVDLSRLTRKEAARIVGKKHAPCVSFETDADGDVIFRSERARAPGLVAIASAGLLAACARDERRPPLEIVPEPAIVACDPVTAPALEATGAPAPRLELAAPGDRNDVSRVTSTPPTTSVPPGPARGSSHASYVRRAGRRPSFVRHDRNH